MQRCHRHGGPAEGQQGVTARVCHTRVQVPAALLADHRHGRQRSSASKPAPRMEARHTPSRTWGPGAAGQRLKSLGHQPLGGGLLTQQAWAQRGHMGSPPPPFSPARPHPGRTLVTCPPGPPWLGTRTRLQGGQRGQVPASTGRDSRTSSSREPQGGAHRPPPSRETRQTHDCGFPEGSSVLPWPKPLWLGGGTRRGHRRSRGNVRRGAPLGGPRSAPGSTTGAGYRWGNRGPGHAGPHHADELPPGAGEGPPQTPVTPWDMSAPTWGTSRQRPP